MDHGLPGKTGDLGAKQGREKGPTGCSQIIDPTGRIVGQSPLYAATPTLRVGTRLVGDVRLGDGKGRPFTRLGAWLVYLCLLATVALLWRAPSRTSP